MARMVPPAGSRHDATASRGLGDACGRRFAAHKAFAIAVSFPK